MQEDHTSSVFKASVTLCPDRAQQTSGTQYRGTTENVLFPRPRPARRFPRARVFISAGTLCSLCPRANCTHRRIGNYLTDASCWRDLLQKETLIFPQQLDGTRVFEVPSTKTPCALWTRGSSPLHYKAYLPAR